MKRLLCTLMVLFLLTPGPALSSEDRADDGTVRPQLTAIEATRLMGNGINLGNTMEACDSTRGNYASFSNPMNKDMIEVLDLYVYNIGIGSDQISLSTVVGISKSLVGIVLLFTANGISKAVRGESII